jgi:hypothetical protein
MQAKNVEKAVKATADLAEAVKKADCGEEKKQEIAQKIESVQKELETIQTALPTERIWQIIKKFKTEEISKLVSSASNRFVLFESSAKNGCRATKKTVSERMREADIIEPKITERKEEASLSNLKQFASLKTDTDVPTLAPRKEGKTREIVASEVNMKPTTYEKLGLQTAIQSFRLASRRLPIAMIIGKTAKRPCLEFAFSFFLLYEEEFTQ